MLITLYCILQTKSGEDIPTHRTVLSMHSDYFMAMFTSGLQEAQVSNPKINLTEYPVDIVKAVLKFMYTGSLTGELFCNSVGWLVKALRNSLVTFAILLSTCYLCNALSSYKMNHLFVNSFGIVKFSNNMTTWKVFF